MNMRKSHVTLYLSYTHMHEHIQIIIQCMYPHGADMQSYVCMHTHSLPHAETEVNTQVMAANSNDTCTNQFPQMVRDSGIHTGAM